MRMGGSRGGGRGSGPPLPEKSQHYKVSQQYWSGSPGKSQGYQASIQCWAMNGTSGKRHFKGVCCGGPSLARLWWYLVVTPLIN